MLNDMIQSINNFRRVKTESSLIFVTVVEVSSFLRIGA